MDESDRIDDELDIELRSPEEIAARLVILAAIVRRATLELPLDRDASDGDTPEGERFDLQVALTEPPLVAHVTAAEQQFLSAPLGSAGEARALAEAWRIEALAALTALVVPDHFLGEPWEQTDPGPLLARIPEPSDDLRAFSASLDLPSDEDAAFAREAAELWAWRAAIDDDLRNLTGRRLSELRDTLAETAAEAAATGLLPDVQDDFQVAGHPYAEADPETKALIAEISLQRLTALNWFCGFGDSWDSVPLDI